MWENEYRKTFIRNILLGAILAVLILALGIGYLLVSRRISREDALLLEVQSSQRQELSDARQENKERIDQIYSQHQSILAQYLPGIVCWGDSLTAGSSGNVSYPHTLQKYLNVYVADIYDLRYSLDTVEGLSALDWDDYQISVPVVNMGAGRENVATILGRSGVVPFVVTGDFVIPAEVQSVSVSIASENGDAVMPLIAGGGGVNPVTIAGVRGTLTRTAGAQQWNQHIYQFTRLEAGPETQVAKGTGIVTEAADDYRDYIHIVWMGTYGSFTSPERLVADTKLLLQRQNINTDRFLVIGPCAYNGTWSGSVSYPLDSVDSAMLQAFGDRYINLRKYLMEDGMRDAGLAVTSQDKQSINNGCVPNSFRSNASGADLNGVAYDLLGRLVYERMDRLGYLDEVRQQLNLERSIQEILKEDPAYFENRLKAY